MTQAEALKVLKMGVPVFLTGEPGSGKTHTVNEYVRYLRGHGVGPAITASTGIAATHLGGLTIHSWSGIGVRRELTDRDLDFLSQNERLARRVRQATVLIIDEISMLSATTFDLVERVCRELRQSSDVFGGLQVVLCGDFFQLPPVSQFAAGENNFAYRAPSWAALKPVVCYLAEQHRQEDENFLAVLGGLRRATLSNEQRAHLEGRVVKEGDSPAGITKLFPHNADVDRINETELEKLPGTARRFTMKGRGAPAMIESLKRNCLSPETLTLKMGAKVMFTKNSLEGRFVNGTTGEVTGFDRLNGWPVVKTRVGRSIAAKPLEWTVEVGGKVLARIEQIPLRLAWAMTVHKSQGMSLDAAVMDLSAAFEYGQGYVALSRVRTLAGLHLLGFNDRALEVHPEVLAIDSAFREASRAARTRLENLDEKHLTTLHHNFIRACGGSLTPVPPKPQKSDLTTLDQTLALMREKKSLAEIAVVRKLTVGTIINHLEELRRLGKVSAGDLAHLKPTDDLIMTEIHTVFRTLGADLLRPVYDYFAGAHPYDRLRLARLLFEK